MRSTPFIKHCVRNGSRTSDRNGREVEDVQKGIQRGRSDARTKLEAFFNILLGLTLTVY